MISKVYQDPKHPWNIEIFELLETKVPGPHLAQPHCCYMSTVIFYARPFIVRPWHLIWICNGKRRAQKPGRSFQELGRVETRLTWNTVIYYRGERFKCGGGRVMWEFGRWWMRHYARRETPSA